MEIRVDDRPVFVYTAAHAFEATRPSIVWVHGAGLDHSWWALQSRYFGYHGWNVLAVDLPGHGRSAGPAIAGIDAQAEWVLRLMDAIGVQQAAVVGHSMGSLIALACAARAPDRIRALALLGTAFPMQVSAAFLAAAKANSVDAFDMETIWGHAPDVPFASNPNPGMWMYGDTLARLLRLAPGVLHTDLQSCNDYQGGLTAAAQIRCPTLLIAGERDMMTPPKASATLAQAIAGVQIVRLAQSGHSMMAEAPDATLDALIKFLTPLA